MAESEPALTVAICTRNRRDSLLRALASLARQETRAAWDVLVVENASEDDTRTRGRRRSRATFPVPLAVASEPVRGLSHARNRALAISARPRGRLSSTTTPRAATGWVEAHAEGLAAPDVVATGGPILPVLPHGLDPAWRAFLERADRRADRPLRLRARPAGMRSRRRAAAVRRQSRPRRARPRSTAGGFRTDLGWGRRRIPGEETELLRRLQRRPGRVLYLPGAVVDHHVDAERAVARELPALVPQPGRVARAARSAGESARARWAARRTSSRARWRGACAGATWHALRRARGRARPRARAAARRLIARALEPTRYTNGP